MNSKPRLARRWAAVLTWSGLIFVLSSRGNLPGPGFPHADKIFHAFEFAVLAWLLTSALFPSIPVSRLRGSAIWAISGILCFFYALSDEFHQAFVPGRSCEFSDLIADFAGILTGLAVLYIFMRRRRLESPP